MAPSSRASSSASSSIWYPAPKPRHQPAPQPCHPPPPCEAASNRTWRPSQRFELHDLRIVLDDETLLPSEPWLAALTATSITLVDASGRRPGDDAADADAAASDGGGGPSASSDLLRKSVRIEGLELRYAAREAALPVEFLAVADTREVFDAVLAPALAAALPLVTITEPVPQVHLTVRSGDALEQGSGELGVAYLDVPFAAVDLHEGELRVIAKLLEYWSNFRRFHRNKRALPSRRIRPGCAPELVREWWRWALQAVVADLQRRQSRQLELRWDVLRERAALKRSYKAAYNKVHSLTGGREEQKEALRVMEDNLGVADVLFFRALARAEHAKASSRAAQFELLSSVFQDVWGDTYKVRFRIPFGCALLRLTFTDEAQARAHVRWALENGGGGGEGGGSEGGSTAAAGTPQPPVSPIIEVEFRQIDGDVVLTGEGKQVDIGIGALVIIDRYTPASSCRRCLEAGTGGAATPAGSDDDIGPEHGAEVAPFCQLRVTVSPLTKPPRQTILLWFSPIHIVLTPELMTRLASWGADGWGEARIYGHYLLRWVYRYEHIVKIEVRGFEGALLNTEMGCAPLLHLLCSTLTFESRYTSDQMKAERLTVRASGRASGRASHTRATPHLTPRSPPATARSPRDVRQRQQRAVGASGRACRAHARH